MDKQIENCPFCGNPMDIAFGVNSRAQCSTEDCWLCEAKISIPLDDWRAVRRFNARTTPTPPAGQVEAVALAIHNVKRSFGEAGKISLSEFQVMRNQPSCNGVGSQYSQAMSYANAAIKASGAEHIAGLWEALRKAWIRLDDHYADDMADEIEAVLASVPPELREK